MSSNNLAAVLITFIVALAWLRFNNFAAQRGWISSHLSRKIIHIGTGPLFVLCWPLFTQSPSSPFLAALVPLAITIQFFLVGVGLIKDETAVKAMSRTGDRREILRGPLLYGIVFVLMTVLYWHRTPIGIVALMLLCGGDGLADILGRRFGKTNLPWNPKKSWFGSLGMFLGGWSFSAGILAVYIALNYFSNPWVATLPAVTVIALAATVVESLPFYDIDNITVPITALALGALLF